MWNGEGFSISSWIYYVEGSCHGQSWNTIPEFDLRNLKKLGAVSKPRPELRSPEYETRVRTTQLWQPVFRKLLATIMTLLTLDIAVGFDLGPFMWCFVPLKCVSYSWCTSCIIHSIQTVLLLLQQPGKYFSIYIQVSMALKSFLMELGHILAS
jgi:hypothetical protein